MQLAGAQAFQSETKLDCVKNILSYTKGTGAENQLGLYSLYSVGRERISYLAAAPN